MFIGLKYVKRFNKDVIWYYLKLINLKKQHKKNENEPTTANKQAMIYYYLKFINLKKKKIALKILI